MPVQTLLLALPGRAARVFPQLYWWGFCRLMGIRVRVLGHPPRVRGRPIVYVANHSSWLDIPVLASVVEAAFIAKSEISDWPLVRQIAWLGRTEFVSRKPGTTAKEVAALVARVAAGDSFVLFPEGTTSDGAHVLPFRSPFLALAETDPPPLLQPLSMAYDRLGYLPVGRVRRPAFAWYGDTDLATHFFRIARWRGMAVTVCFLPPREGGAGPDRKALTRGLEAEISAAAAALRQGRFETAEAKG